MCYVPGARSEGDCRKTCAALVLGASGRTGSLWTGDSVSPGSKGDDLPLGGTSIISREVCAENDAPAKTDKRILSIWHSFMLLSDFLYIKLSSYRHSSHVLLPNIFYPIHFNCHWTFNFEKLIIQMFKHHNFVTIKRVSVDLC